MSGKQSGKYHIQKGWKLEPTSVSDQTFQLEILFTLLKHPESTKKKDCCRVNVSNYNQTTVKMFKMTPLKSVLQSL